MPHEGEERSIRVSWLFHGMVLTCCAFLFTMPVLPTTDGPIHRYYVGVLHSVLTRDGSSYDHAYAIRHPFPPYATQYFAMLALTRVWDVNTAEKIFAALTVVVTAYSFRSAARALGNNADVISLGISCILLPWSLWMGFFNYTLAVGLSLLAFSFWLRARRGNRTLWPFFALTCVLVTVTHPIPLLGLLALTFFSLLESFRKGHSGLRAEAAGIFVFVLLLVLYPVSVGGGSHTGVTLQDYGFHLRRIARQCALFGLSPYAVASRGLLSNLYRAAVYVVGIFSAWLGWVSWRQAARQKSIRFVNLLLPAALLLALTILLLPDGVNGSFFFSTRLITFVWIALMLSASDVVFTSVAAYRGWIAAAAGMFVLTLIAAAVLIRPVSFQLASMEREIVPARGGGLVIDPAQDLKKDSRSPLAFTPYHWAGALPLMRAHVLMLDSPWLEQSILPLTYQDASPLLYARLGAEQLRETNHHDGTVRWLQPAPLRAMLKDTSVIFYRIPLKGITLADQIGATEAAAFHCVSRAWYLKCTR